jgi:hypothetical protein
MVTPGSVTKSYRVEQPKNSDPDADGSRRRSAPAMPAFRQCLSAGSLLFAGVTKNRRVRRAAGLIAGRCDREDVQRKNLAVRLLIMPPVARECGVCVQARRWQRSLWPNDRLEFSGAIPPGSCPPNATDSRRPATSGGQCRVLERYLDSQVLHHIPLKMPASCVARDRPANAGMRFEI